MANIWNILHVALLIVSPRSQCFRLSWTGNASVALRAQSCLHFQRYNSSWVFIFLWQVIPTDVHIPSFPLFLSEGISASLQAVWTSPKAQDTPGLHSCGYTHKSISSDLLYVSYILFSWSVKLSERLQVCIQKVSTH